jgi:hypothetical protein
MRVSKNPNIASQQPRNALSAEHVNLKPAPTFIFAIILRRVNDFTSVGA